MSVIDLTNPQGQYGGSAQAVAQILQMWGQIERDKQERQLTDTILQGVASGKDLASVLRDVANQQTQYGSGVGGAMRRFSGNFMPPSQTQQSLAEMGLGMASPQAQANLEGTQARTTLTKEQTTTEQQTRPLEVQTAQARTDLIRQQADAERLALPGQQQKQGLDIERAQQELEEGKMRMQQVKETSNPAMRKYQHYGRMAELALGQLRHGQFLPGEPAYEDATEDFEQARRDMEIAWQEQGGTPPTQAETGQAIQAVTDRSFPKSQTGGGTVPRVGPTVQAAQARQAQPQVQAQVQPQQTPPLPGMMDVWPKLSEEDRDKARTYQEKIIASGDVEALIEFHRKVRELFK